MPDFNKIMSQEMRDKARNLKARGISKSRPRINAKLSEDMRVDIHAVKSKNLFSRIRYVKEKVWH